jgi:hypothetical protein
VKQHSKIVTITANKQHIYMYCLATSGQATLHPAQCAGWGGGGSSQQTHIRWDGSGLIQGRNNRFEMCGFLNGLWLNTPSFKDQHPPAAPAAKYILPLKQAFGNVRACFATLA